MIKVKLIGNKVEIQNAPELSEKNITLRVLENGKQQYYSERLGTLKREKNILTATVEKDSKGKKYLLKQGMDVISEGVLSEEPENKAALKKD